jgi:uncharacterized protein
LKKTVIIGATENRSRYAFRAAEMLEENQIEFVPAGIRQGTVLGKKILDLRSRPKIEGVDTVTLYINPYHQEEWRDYLLSLNPKRIIFNPGTENPGLEAALEEKGIQVLEACTLVLLRSGQF